MQESLDIPKEMTFRDKLNYYASHSQQQQLLVKLVQDLY